MKDHVEIGHLTKYDAFKVNRDQVMDLEMWFKIHTKVSILETASPKIISILKILWFLWYSLKWMNKAISISAFLKKEVHDGILQLSQNW